jgi:hypothetical protein
MGAIIPSILAASAASEAAARERVVLDALDAAGADAPARAVPLDALPPLAPEVFAEVLDRGAVREGAPGTFYRFVSTYRPQSPPAARRLSLLVFGLILLAAWGVLLLLRAQDAR